MFSVKMTKCIFITVIDYSKNTARLMNGNVFNKVKCVYLPLILHDRIIIIRSSLVQSVNLIEVVLHAYRIEGRCIF